MTQAVVLLVEDNPITRKLVRFTLENQGLRVLEAASALDALKLFQEEADIALVLQDLCLPDLHGFELVGQLRGLPGGNDIPILAFSGMLSQKDEGRVSAAGFDDLISKPVEPSRLVQIVRSYLPTAPQRSGEIVGTGRRLIVADDDPVQRKLVSFRMQRAGFQVASALDGADALEQARTARPDAIVSDVLMPRLDGFGLCRELARDPKLAGIPIVLTTNSYVEPIDRELAQRAGARDLVLRTPELTEVLIALEASLTTPASPVDVGDDASFEQEHMGRMMRQLEKQVALNAGASKRCALLAAQISVLKGIAEALANHTDIDEALKYTLAACFDAGGISLGALLLKADNGLRVLSFGFSPSWSEAELKSFFGEPQLLDAALARRESTCITAKAAQPAEQRMLRRASAASAVIIPIGRQHLVFGALVMLSKNGEFDHDDRIKFGEAVAGEISQVLAVAHAFRERERSEREARKQTAILQSVLESIGDGVCVVDGQGETILWNSAAHVITSMRDGPSQVHTNKAGLFEADTVTPITPDRLPLERARRGEAVDGVELFVRHDGAPDGVWLSASGRPWRDEEGVARGAVVVFRDVTQDKATHAQLMASDRLASVGMLAAGVAHELNNPLACVLANLDLAEQEIAERSTSGDFSASGELLEIIEDTRAASDRLRKIVGDLRVFSRHEDVAPTAVDLEKVLESTLRMAWNEIRHRAHVERDYRAALAADGSESRMGQVFLNLIVNAAQAIPEGNAQANTIQIVTYAANDMVHVEISDTGTGIAPSALKHLFRPFFTTKPPGSGTGLGLAISHRIISELGGTIHVESQLGKGTTVRVSLPEARAKRATIRPLRARPAPSRRARVLVVDDEPLILKVVKRTLGREHDVLTTLAATDALARLRAGEKFDVILCDIMMPQMTGMEFHAELCKLDPTIAERVIFLTGGAFTPATRAFLDQATNERVEKPFDASHLKALINDRIS